MNLKLLKNITIAGDTAYRGQCPHESAEQITLFNQLPPRLKKIATHIRNEGKRTVQQAQRHKIEGMNTGASDIIIPCSPPFVIELKRKDHTKSKISKEQVEYLEECQKQGALVCVALGWESALEFIKSNTHMLSCF